jgi:hypothetical protein
LKYNSTYETHIKAGMLKEDDDASLLTTQTLHLHIMHMQAAYGGYKQPFYEESVK